MSSEALRRLALNLDPLAKPDEELAYTVGILVYLWGYPLWFLDRLRRGMLEAAKRPVSPGDNAFIFEKELKGPGSVGTIAPTNDTLDAFAWLDLRRGPVLLRLPEIRERYFVFQCVDAYTNNFAYVSQLRYGPRPPAVAFCPPGWQGVLPWKAVPIPVPTPTACIFGRLQMEGASDLAAVRALQRGIELIAAGKSAASSDWRPAPDRPAEPAGDQALTFCETVGELMVMNPPPSRDASLMSLFEMIGFDGKSGFDASDLEAQVLRGLHRGIGSAARVLNEKARTAGELLHGWNVFEIGEIFGSDLLFRAISAYITPFGGLFINEPAEAFFPQAYFDGDGERLDTSRWTYTLRFEPGELPPVDGFWSITLYERSTRRPVPNALGRYSVRAGTPGLRYGADGALTLYLRRDPPRSDLENNWMPAPNAAIYLTLRMYRPRPEAWNGGWTPPPVRKEKRLSSP